MTPPARGGAWAAALAAPTLCERDWLCATRLRTFVSVCAGRRVCDALVLEPCRSLRAAVDGNAPNFIDCVTKAVFATVEWCECQH